MEQIDISTITDMDKLKSLAFDTVQAIEAQQQNLRILQARMQEVAKAQETKKK